MADRQMYAFQSSKYASSAEKITSEPRSTSYFAQAPRPAPFPKSHHPGFITSGLFAWTRHPNFAAEQLFWFSQALFVVCAGDSSGVTRLGWVRGSVLGPSFAVNATFALNICIEIALIRLFIVEYPILRQYDPNRMDHRAQGEQRALIDFWPTEHEL